ncbi:MAG: MMPL family transporter [Acidimicrobiales bacterium]
MTGRPGRPRGRGPSGLYAAAIVWLRYLVVPLWLVAVAAVLMLIPPLSATGSANFAALLPKSSPAVAAEVSSVRAFGYPLQGGIVVVQHRSGGLSPLARAEVYYRAAKVDLHVARDLPGLVAAVPVTHAVLPLRGARHPTSAALTWLAFRPGTPLSSQVSLSQRYAASARKSQGGGFAGVTGLLPARYAAGNQVTGRLNLVEEAVVLLVAVVIGLTFRSVVAPLAVLGTAVVAYLVAIRLLSLLAGVLGLSVPSELEPLIVVLLLGITTDYAVFFLSEMRAALRRGLAPREASVEATAEVAPLVLAAGLTVAGGTASLTVARLSLFRQLGPGMAITVVVTVIAAVTLLPALMALLGRWMYWPSRPGGDRPAVRRWRRAAVRVATWRPVAAVLLALGIAIVVFVAHPVGQLRLGVDLLRSLPQGSQVRQADAAASASFAPGVVSPSVVVVRDGESASPAALARFGRSLAAQPGVAGVLGPGDLPAAGLLEALANQPGAERPGAERAVLGGGNSAALAHLGSRLAAAERGAFVTPQGHEARYLVILSDPPLGAAAIHDVQQLQRSFPRLLASNGLAGANAAVAGPTAIAAEITALTQGDITRVAAAALGVNFTILAVLLTALLTPLLLVAASVGVVAAGVGATVWLAGHFLGLHSLTFYVPFAVAVLLLSFGADYNLFVVGRIWEAARERPFRDAIAEAGSEASSAVSVAGLTLALSFALLAVIQLAQFYELAAAMLIGVLLDTFLVRAIMVPAMLSLLGGAAFWPRRRPRGGG